MSTCSLRETLAFVRDPAAFTAGAGLSLGDFYRVRLPGRRLHVVTDPGLAERILVRDAPHFQKSRIYWAELRRSLGESLGSLEGERWEYLHQVERPYFNPEAVASHLPAVERQTTLQLERLAESLAARPEVALLDVLGELNARIVLCALFGQSDEPAALELARHIADGHALIAWKDRWPWRPALAWFNGVGRRAARHKLALGAYAGQVRRSPSAYDPRLLLHALLHVEQDPAAPRFQDDLLRNEITFHLGASTETQAAATGWALYLLWRHPATLQRLREELWLVAGESLVSAEHVPALAYTKQVLQEALRLFPPVFAILRDCVRPLEWPGGGLRQGATLLVSVIGLQRNPRLWSAPLDFRPERFDPQRASAIGRFHYLPFGAGRHACIGRHLALPGMLLTLAQFAQRFDWSFSNPDIRPVARPSLKPAPPFVARLTRRDLRRRPAC